MNMTVLVTGGAGYIGSHTCVEILNAGYNVVVIDNLYNSNIEALHRVMKITGKSLKFYKGDILDKELLEEIFRENNIEAVLHFAGLKAVGESVRIPLSYYYNNVSAAVVLCQVMSDFGVKKIIFSSSAAVYGVPDHVPITENFPRSAANPYGRTKLFIEDILTDLYRSDPAWSVMLLRYFNPIGAHLSGEIGEAPSAVPNNLMPYITQVAAGNLKELRIFGGDYPTPDGTCVRDYIHIVDLACGHVSALNKINSDPPGIGVFNLGTGCGYSVLQVVHAFEEATGIALPYRIVGRRPGDIAQCYADPSKAWEEMHWRTQRDILQMCEDSWRWQKNNPSGYC